MNGLEQILLKIEDDGKAEAKKITDDAERESASYIAAAEKSAKKDAEIIINAAQKKAHQLIENAESGSLSYIKRQELAAKSEIISDCISTALKEMESARTDKYFEMLFKLILKYSHENQGELRLNETDMERMPEDFIEKVNKSLSEKNASVILAQKPYDIKPGCVIAYGEIEENCTFDALIEEKKDEIKDRLYKRLNS